MTDLRVRDILRWQLYGVATSLSVGLALALSGRFNNAHLGAFRSAIGGLTTVAAYNVFSFPIAFALLYVWCWAEREVPDNETNIWRRFLGLISLGAIANSIAVFSFLAIVAGQDASAMENAVHSITVNWSAAAMLGGVPAILLPRLFVKSLRRSVRLAPPAVHISVTQPF